MKYILSIGAFLLLVGGVFWYTSDSNNGYNKELGNMMPGMMRNESKESLTTLPGGVLENVKPTEVIELKDGDTFNLTASIVQQEVGNRTVKRLAYNGQIPGPVLKVQKGAKVTVNFTNNIDMETSLHSHGLRGDYLMDGAVPITPAIPVGESFSYELEFPDTGVYWYHPHVREDYQQELGLYGNMIVTEEGYWSTVDKEDYLILDDVLEGGDFKKEVVTNTLMGRFGNTLLINDQEDFTLTVNQGEITRLFLTNVANTRTFDVSFDGAKTKLVGGDNGRIEKEIMVDDVIVGTSERYVVEVLFPEAGTYPITHRGKKIGMVVVKSSTVNKNAEFMTLRSNVGDYSSIRSNQSQLFAKIPDKNLRLDIEMKGVMGSMMSDMGGQGNGMMMGGSNDDDMMRDHCQMMPEMAGCEPYLEGGSEEAEHGEDGIEWEDDMAMMNQMSTDENIEWVIEDTDSGKKNDKIEWSFKTGDLVKVRIYNDEKGLHPMQHPIHFHGQRFVV